MAVPWQAIATGGVGLFNLAGDLFGGGKSDDVNQQIESILKKQKRWMMADREWFENYMQPYQTDVVQSRRRLLPINEQLLTGMAEQFASPEKYAHSLATKTASGTIPTIRRAAASQRDQELQRMGSMGLLGSSGRGERRIASLGDREFQAVSDAYSRPYLAGLQAAPHHQFQLANLLANRAALPTQSAATASPNAILGGLGDLSDRYAQSNADMWYGISRLAGQTPDIIRGVSGLWDSGNSGAQAPEVTDDVWNDWTGGY